MPDDQEQVEEVDEGGDAERFVQLKREDIRQLEKKAKAADAANAELEELRKERLFFKAKIDVDSPLGRLLYDGYKGELTVEAITEAASGIPGLGVAPTDEVPPEERSSTDERRDLGAGSRPDEFKPQDKDPKIAAVEAGNAALDAGRSEEVALGAVFEHLMKSAMAGDTRVLWDPTQER